MNANAISDLCALSTLGRQLNMCAGSQNIDVSSVLLLNDVDLQCDKLLVLIDECIKANDKDSSASNHTTLSETLTTLNEIAARSSNEFLTKHDRLEDLRLWITILKVLCDSFAFLKTMNAEERQYLEAFYGALDRMRGFDFIKNIRNAMEITEDMPPGFKFPVVVVEKLSNVERVVLSQNFDAELLSHFYALLFFVYENAANHIQTCSEYKRCVNANKFDDVQQDKRNAASGNACIDFCGRILKEVFHQRPSKIAYLFAWLYVFNPEMSLVRDNVDNFNALPDSPLKGLIQTSDEHQMPNRFSSSDAHLVAQGQSSPKSVCDKTRESYPKCMAESKEQGDTDQVPEGNRPPYQNVVKNETSSRIPTSSNWSVQLTEEDVDISNLPSTGQVSSSISYAGFRGSNDDRSYKVRRGNRQSVRGNIYRNSSSQIYPIRNGLNVSCNGLSASHDGQNASRGGQNVSRVSSRWDFRSRGYENTHNIHNGDRYM